MTSADFLSALSRLPFQEDNEALKKELSVASVTGAVRVRTRALDLDTDGFTAPGVVLDQTHQNATSLTWPLGSPVNSNATRYVVLPGGGWMKRHGLRLGDVGLACVAGWDKVVSVIVADTGPPDKLGEGSMALHRALGHETLINGHIKDVGIDREFTMMLFPGTSTGHCVNNVVHEATALARFEALAG